MEEVSAGFLRQRVVAFGQGLVIAFDEQLEELDLWRVGLDSRAWKRVQDSRWRRALARGLRRVRGVLEARGLTPLARCWQDAATRL
jgi:hypothetical protein